MSKRSKEKTSVGRDLLTLHERGSAAALSLGYAAVNVYSLVVSGSPLYIAFFLPPLITCIGVLALNRPRPWAWRLVQAGALLMAIAAFLTGTFLSVEPPLIEARSGGGCLVNIIASFLALALLSHVSRGEVSQRLWDMKIDSDEARFGVPPTPELSTRDQDEVVFDLDDADSSESASTVDKEAVRHQ